MTAGELDYLSGTDALAAVGYRHKPTERSAITSKHAVIRNNDGVVVGWMDAFEARAFADRLHAEANLPGATKRNEP